MNSDHVVGGGIAVVLTTNLPAVLAAPHWFGPDAPVNQETALLIGAGAALYAVLKAFITWGRTPDPPVTKPVWPPRETPQATPVTPAS